MRNNSVIYWLDQILDASTDYASINIIAQHAKAEYEAEARERTRIVKMLERAINGRNVLVDENKNILELLEDKTEKMESTNEA